MGFLRRIAMFAAAPSVAAAARHPPTARRLTLGQFVRPRRAQPADWPAWRAGFAPATDQELNNGVWPEAGADSAPGENSVPDANPADAGHREVDLRQPVSDPWEVAGNSERKGVPSKQRSWQKLEVSRLLGERIQSGKSVESAQRPVFDTSAKAVSEWTSVHTNPPSHRPAKHSSASAATPAPSTPLPAAPPDVSSPDSGPAPRPASIEAAFSGTGEPDTQAGMVPSGGFVDRVRGTSEPVSRGMNAFQGSITPYPLAASLPTRYSDTSDTGLIVDTAPAPSLSTAVSEAIPSETVASGSHERPSRPAVPVGHADTHTAGSPGPVEVAASPTESPVRTDPRPDARARIDASGSAPAVHIGTVEIFIEAAPVPRSTPSPVSREGDFASRHYLRGL